MGTLDDRLRQHQANRDAELAEAEAAAIASGKEPFDLAKLETLLEAEPGAYADRETDLRRSYFVMQTRLNTLAEFAVYVREMQDWGFFGG